MELYDSYVLDWMGVAMTDREGELLLPGGLRVVYPWKPIERERERERAKDSPKGTV